MPVALKVGSLFSGIGGLDLGLERAGMHVLWQVENDPYCQRVLEKQWPTVQRYSNIKDIDWADVPRVDLVCGGFPCQPVSQAGSRKGQEDARWLWQEYARCLRILRPRYALIENVPGLLSLGMSDVMRDLAACGYDAEWDMLPAAAFGAWHLRYRVFIVAWDANGGEVLSLKAVCGERETANSRRGGAGWDDADANRTRLEKRQSIGSDTRQEQPTFKRSHAKAVCDDDSERKLQSQGRIFNQRRRPCDTGRWSAKPGVCGVAHGVPNRVDRLKGLGNAVVPQVAEWIGKAIIREDLKGGSHV